MKWRAFSRMPQWVRLSEWLGVIAERIERRANDEKAEMTELIQVGPSN